MRCSRRKGPSQPTRNTKKKGYERDFQSSDALASWGNRNHRDNTDTVRLHSALVVRSSILAAGLLAGSNSQSMVRTAKVNGSRGCSPSRHDGANIMMLLRQPTTVNIVSLVLAVSD